MNYFQPYPFQADAQIVAAWDTDRPYAFNPQNQISEGGILMNNLFRVVVLGVFLSALFGVMPHKAPAQEDIDTEIKKLEELEARLDAKLQRREKIKQLDELRARVDAKLKRLEETDSQPEPKLQPVASRSRDIVSQGGNGMSRRPLAMPAAMVPAGYPTFELFGGGQYSNLGIFGGRQHAFGWDGRLGVNFHRNIGIAADFGGAYGNTSVFSCSSFSCGSSQRSFSVYHLGIGPQLAVRDELLNAFLYVPVGFVRSKLAGQQATYDFALSPAIGLDINFGKNVGYRLFELQYVGVNSKTAGWTHNIRTQTGLVYRFGY